jgi:hypothetical protein
LRSEAKTFNLPDDIICHTAYKPDSTALTAGESVKPWRRYS